MELFSLMGRIAIDNADANSQIDETTDKAENSSNKMKSAFKTVGKAVGTFLAVEKIASFGSYLMNLGQETLEFAGNQSKLSASLKDTGHSAEYMENTYRTLYGYLGDDMAVTNTILNMEKLGLSQKETTALTDSAIAVWTAYGDSIPIEGLAESINETVMVGEVTGSLADALNWAGISEDNFNLKLAKCNSEQERAKLITETLNSTYGESKKEYDELTEKSRKYQESQAELQLAETKLGQAMIPLNTTFNNIKSTLASGLVPVVGKLASGFSNLVGKLGPLVSHIKNVGDNFQNVKKWAQENETQLTLLGVAVAGLTTALLIHNAAKIAKIALDKAETIGIMALYAQELIATGITTGLTIATTALSAVIGFLTSPITLVILAITALIAIGVALYKNWDTVKAKATTIWNSIKTTIGNVCNGIKTVVSSAFSYVVNTVQSKFNSVKTSISNAINSAKNVVSNGLNAIKGFFNNCKLTLPKIKLPHFSILGKLSLNPISVPKISVKWYAKGAVMNDPTIFGMSRNTLHVGGEAGPEAIAPIDTLMSYVERAVENKTNGMNESINVIIDLLNLFMPQILENMRKDIVLNNGVLVGELAPSFDEALGKIYSAKGRGR